MPKKPRVLFMGKDKPSVFTAYLNPNIEPVAIVMPYDKDENYKKSNLYKFAQAERVPFYTDRNIYEHVAARELVNRGLKEVDLVISFLFPKKIKPPLIKFSRLGCVNFHSAPLPNYRGWGVYNAAILNGDKQWGVSAHFVDENFDTGDIIKVDYFDIDPQKETAYSIEKKSQEKLVELFDEIIDMVVNGKELPRTPQKLEHGVTYTKKDTLKYEIITKDDSEEAIDKKTRAFWFPPFSAKFELNGKMYPFVSQEILNEFVKEC